MRRAHNETGWIVDEQSNVLGFSLGYDFCSEHEWGANYLKSALGIPGKAAQVGIEDRTMTALRECDFHLVEFAVKSGPKEEKQTRNHALLVLSSTPGQWTDEPRLKKEWAQRLSVDFFTEPSSKYYRPEKDDVAVAWSGSDGFAIHVRGDQNIERLKALRASFLNNDIALMDASAVGFMRKALALVIPSAVPQDLKDQLRSGDLARERLLKAAKDTGIAEHLRKAGCKHYALSPAWRNGDEATGELMFFVNPESQRTNACGWFTLGELQQWTKGEGPVVEGLSAKAALTAQQGDNYGFDLVHEANESGVFLNNTTEVWLDAQRTKPGIRVLFSPKNETTFDDGAYSIEALQEIFEAAKAKLSKPKTIRPCIGRI